MHKIVHMSEEFAAGEGEREERRRRRRRKKAKEITWKY